MSTENLAKKIVENLTKSASSEEIETEKSADIEKDLFGFAVPESASSSASDGDSDTDLFGYKADNKKDRNNSALPPVTDNSDEHDGDSPDLEEDLDQGEEANTRSDDQYTGSGEGKKL